MGNLILRLLTLITALQVVVSSSAAAAAAAAATATATARLDVGGALLHHHQLGRPCSSTDLLGECSEGYDVKEEFQMDSEINRRMLAAVNISAALKPNMAVCNKQRPNKCLPDVNKSNQPGECGANSTYKRTCPKV